MENGINHSNFLISGPYGVGKSTITYALAQGIGIVTFIEGVHVFLPRQYKKECISF